MKENTAPLIGRPAPDFTLPRSAHQTFSLRDVAGSPAILVFYPGDWEPVSSEQLRMYQEYLRELYAFDAVLVGISTDTVWSHEAYAAGLGITFPLLSDSHPKGQVSREYGVYQEEIGRSSRALFVLDGEGIVRWARNYPTNLNPGVEGTLAALKAHQQPPATVET